MIINLQPLIRFCFLATLFLYPFCFFNHNLFLIPQLGFVTAVIMQRVFRQEIMRVTPLSALIILLTLLVCITPLFIKQLHEGAESFLFPIKLTLNFLTVSVVMLCGQDLINEKDIKTLKSFRNTYLLICLLTYFFIASYEQIGITLLSFIKNPNSSRLYSLADPLNSVFITKNITAMYMISLFAYDLFLSSFFHKKFLARDWLLYGFFILLFFSRQSLLAYIVLGIVYYFFYANNLKKIIGFVASAVIGLLFFWTLFDLSSKHDGANQRIDLYNLFFEQAENFFFFGMGLDGMEKTIRAAGIDIDNYHLFFMNQMGIYGFFHMFAFNLLLILILFYIPQNYRKYSVFLMIAYWSNVMFQTFGYEFQNLWLFMIMVSIKKAVSFPPLCINRT